MWKHASLILALAACGAFPRPPDLVACTPGQFAQCRGDTELICNTAGTDYDAVSCGRGCEPTIGCRLCDANQTVCTNGKVQRCDATGTVTSSEACPLGCFEDQPRCREIDPSNNLASYMDMAATAPDLDLSMGGGIVADTGIVATSKGTRISTPSFVIPAPPGGSPIRVFLANHVQLGGVVEVVVSHLGTGPALAIVAHDRILVNGTLVFSIDSRGGFSAGGVTFPECIGGQSALWHVADGPTYYSGTGGGGHATMGGKGGDMIGVLRDPMPGGAGGKASGNPTLVPLRGGCGSGSEAPSPAIGSSGGGALQLSSRIEITVAANSVLNLNGGRGLAGPDIGGPSAVNGGGAGGGILLEGQAARFFPSPGQWWRRSKLGRCEGDVADYGRDAWRGWQPAVLFTGR